jgi:hypothetical protein
MPSAVVTRRTSKPFEPEAPVFAPVFCVVAAVVVVEGEPLRRIS